MNDLPIMAGLRAFWATITTAIADTFQLHDATAEGLDTAVEGADVMDMPGAGWADTLPGGAEMGAPGGRDDHHRDRESEGWRRQDDAHRAPRGLPGRAGPPVRRDRRRPTGQHLFLVAGRRHHAGRSVSAPRRRPPCRPAGAYRAGLEPAPARGQPPHRRGFIYLAATGQTVRLDRATAPAAGRPGGLSSLLDTMPSKGAGFRETLFAADWVLVPTQLERLAWKASHSWPRPARSWPASAGAARGCWA